MTFGEKLRQLRMERGLSQETLALELGVSRQAISRWELNEVVPDTANVLALSRYFGVSTDYLLREDCLSDQDIPAVKRARLDLRQRQQAVGGGILCRIAMLACPALYHSEVRLGGETEMLPFLLGLAFLLGCLLAKLNWNILRDLEGETPWKLLFPDLLAVFCICFLPPLLDWVPAGYGLLLSQLAAVPFLLKSRKILCRIYNLPE